MHEGQSEVQQAVKKYSYPAWGVWFRRKIKDLALRNYEPPLNKAICEFASKVELGSSAVRGWTNGASRPPLSKIATIAAVLECSEKEVLEVMGYDAALSPEEIRKKKRKQSIERHCELHKVELRAAARARWRAKYFPGIKAKPAHLKTPRRLKWEAVHALVGEEKEAALKHSSSAAKAARRARQRQATGSFSAAQFSWVMKQWGYSCVYCGLSRWQTPQLRLTADHLVALNRGGTNTVDNIVPACLSCNSSKQDKDLVAWASSKGYPISDRLLGKYQQLIGIQHAG